MLARDLQPPRTSTRRWYVERLYLFSEDGTVGLAEANPLRYIEHGRFELQTGNAPTWAHPVVADGKLFLRDQDTLYAYDVAAR